MMPTSEILSSGITTSATETLDLFCRHRRWMNSMFSSLYRSQNLRGP
jgi:hypothetical protein